MLKAFEEGQAKQTSGNDESKNIYRACSNTITTGVVAISEDMYKNSEL